MASSRIFSSQKVDLELTGKFPGLYLSDCIYMSIWLCCWPQWAENRQLIFLWTQNRTLAPGQGGKIYCSHITTKFILLFRFLLKVKSAWVDSAFYQDKNVLPSHSTDKYSRRTWGFGKSSKQSQSTRPMIMYHLLTWCHFYNSEVLCLNPTFHSAALKELWL